MGTSITIDQEIERWCLSVSCARIVSPNKLDKSVYIQAPPCYQEFDVNKQKELVYIRTIDNFFVPSYRIDPGLIYPQVPFSAKEKDVFRRSSILQDEKMNILTRNALEKERRDLYYKITALEVLNKTDSSFSSELDIDTTSIVGLFGLCFQLGHKEFLLNFKGAESLIEAKNKFLRYSWLLYFMASQEVLLREVDQNDIDFYIELAYDIAKYTKIEYELLHPEWKRFRKFLLEEYKERLLNSIIGCNSELPYNAEGMIRYVCALGEEDLAQKYSPFLVHIRKELFKIITLLDVLTKRTIDGDQKF